MPQYVHLSQNTTKDKTSAWSFEELRIASFQYLRNVFVSFFPLFLYLPLNANNPHCTRSSCLQHHEGKKNTRSETQAIQELVTDTEGEGKTNNEEGTNCGQLLVVYIH